MPTIYRQTYFRSKADGEGVTTPIMQMVTFRQANLMNLDAIFLGSSESVGRITAAFRPVHLGGMLTYVK